MPYLYNVSIVVDDDPDKLFHQTVIDNALEEAFKKHPDIHLVGSRISELDTENCGRCCRCGAWVSNQEQEPYIAEFSDGCRIHDAWWCDLCLPDGHPKRFV